MGVEKAAEVHIDLARDALESVIYNLSHVVIERCDGYSDYKPEYLKKLKDALSQLLDIRDIV